MAARRLSKKMYKNHKITKKQNNTKYELCNLYIYYKIKICFVGGFFRKKTNYVVFQKFESILALGVYFV